MRLSTGVGLISWLALCVSLALVWGAGAGRYVTGSELDSPPMFWAGVVMFGVAAVGSLLLRATGATERKDDSPVNAIFLCVTALLAMGAGIVLDAMN